MKKTLLALLSATLILTVISPAQAEDQKVLAIIDTAIDSNKVTSVIHEVCFTDSKVMACPNGQLFMEGKGSAGSKAWPTSIHNATYHGHNVTQVALSVDPTIKIVFVRVANITSLGNSGVTTNTLTLGMDWVSKNAAKYGIDAVSISQSSISKNNLEACNGVGTLKNEGLRAINAVSLLNASNIAVFIATGNDSSNTVVGFPSCVNGAIGVGSIKPNLAELSSFTNRGPGLDAVSSAGAKIINYRGTQVDITGTSVSTPSAAAMYVKNKGSGTFDEFKTTLTNALGYLYINN
jgi:hypothetical protein